MSAIRTPSAVAMRRIQSELREWTANPPEGACLESCEPLLNWVILIQGPDSVGGLHLYDDEVFRLRVNFNENYPLSAPEFFFDPAACPLHNHIYSNGHICLDILYDGQRGGWSPALTISKVVLSLRSMLASSTEKRRPPGDNMYCLTNRGKSPKDTHWEFDDDTV